MAEVPIPQWQHFLIDKATGEYFTYSGTTVTTTVTETPLFSAPDGWQDISIAWERDMTKIGVFRNFSVPLGFVLDGAAILREAFYTTNIEREITLLIKKHRTEITSTYFRHNYDFFYEGEIDLTSFKDDGIKVIVGVAEGGIIKKLNAAADTQFEIPITSDLYVPIKMDGLFLQMSVSYLLIADGYSFNKLVGLQFINSEGTAPGFAAFDVFKQQPPTNFSASQSYFATTTQVINNIRVRGTIIAGTVTGESHSLKIKNQNGTVVATLFSVTGASGTFVSHSVDVTFNGAAGDRFFMESDSDFLATYKEARLTLTFQSRYRTTVVYGYKAFWLARLIIEKITGSTLDVDTTYLEAFENIVITSGDAIRSLTGAKIKTTLNDFRRFCRVVLGLGFGVVNNKVVFAPYTYFFPVVSPILMGRIKNLTVSDATDLRVNTIKIGYLEKQIDDVNGKYEFNNTHIYQAPITRIKKELDLVSPYYAQPYAIEILRINLDGKLTTDSNSDNDNFIIDVDYSIVDVINTETVYALRRPVFTLIEGVPDTVGIFNITLSPKRLLELHRTFIDSLMQGFSGQLLKFLTTEKNPLLKTTLGTTVIEEKADYTIADNNLFSMFYLDMDTEEPLGLAATMDTNPNESFQFGDTILGFIIKAGIQPDTKQEQSYKLLAGPDTHIQNIFIDGYK
jgi:hypothetical protein